jgi:nicotinamidase-related amidase
MSELILEPRRTAVVVIDLQKGIVGFPGNPHSAQGVIANTVALLDAARSVGAQPILVHVGRSPDGADGLDVACDQPMRMAGALPPDWSELIPELNRQPGDLVILKRQWGAFYGTDLELQLRRRGLSTIVLCGIATAFGVESTARDAYERGFQQVFAEDAMTSRTAECHANAIANIFPRLGRVRSTAEIVAALRAGQEVS